MNVIKFKHNAPKGILWFVHDNPGITEKVPYESSESFLQAIKNFSWKYGFDHDSEFMIIFINPMDKDLIQSVRSIVGDEIDLLDMYA